jgi:hypothetical protein
MRDRDEMALRIFVGVFALTCAAACSSATATSDAGPAEGGHAETGADVRIENDGGTGHDAAIGHDGSGDSGGDSGAGATDAKIDAGACPRGTALADGCKDAPAGTPQLPQLLDLHEVVMLNILPGSGYADGTFDWTATGGGGTGAAGTVTVSGGLLGGQDNQGYTISNPGSGYTSRPTISVTGLTGGTGGTITPSVYQATPHNASTPWNMPGVDYYVGIPSGTTLKDPTTSGNLPSGAALAGSTVTVTGCGVTLDSLDFTLHATALVINVTASTCTTTVQNSKFSANATSLYPIALLQSLGSGGEFVFQRNEYDGLAAINDTSGSGFDVNDPLQGSGKVTLLYNYFHDFDSKVIQMSGTSSSEPFTEKYNLYLDFGSCSSPPCSHGEAEYTYSGGTLSMTSEFNTYLLHFHSKSGDLTSAQAVQADDVDIDGTSDDHNVILAPGPQSTCNHDNAIAYTAAATVFDGQQEGGNLTNMTFEYNYIDNSGTYFPWYDATGTGVIHSNNVDTGTGGPCNCNTISGDGSCD